MARHLALPAVLIAALILGCGPNPTGPQVCLDECVNLYQPLFDEEVRLHSANVEDCEALPEPQQDDCLEEEDARHEGEMQRLTDKLSECRGSCHEQGGGTGG